MINCQVEAYQEIAFQRSPITQQLIQFLRNVSVGDIVTYKDLNEVACCDIQKKNRHFLDNALDIVSKDYGILFRCVYGKGFIRLDNSQISKYANHRHISRLKEDTKRYQQKLNCVDTSILSSVERQEYTLAVLHVNVRSALGNPQFNNTVRKELAQSPEQQINKAKLIEQLKVFG